ncbi:Astacin (Peptidase family M12A) [Pseudomonas sp. GM74]|uniref:M12 family metallopeptidase n=1 Tax=Pseudomonas sp. GM74 TaxID=1144336 RepID=UPI000270B3B1|nr:M12 family metallopeptidase [Pseudomonas sp. GM74]EJM84651.1 Astacin (Peptidase family M12A) [Pseudomonas sp. GM74]
MDTLHLCGGINPVDNKVSYELATQEDNSNKPNRVKGGINIQSIGTHSKFWAQHRTLKIGYFSKHTQLMKFIETALKLWTPHINLNIKFVEKVEEADIRISFSSKTSGHWSYVGTDALSVPSNQATMHFDLNAKFLTEHWIATILHEFGHAFGLEHEHQHPEANIDWNTPAVYRECEKQLGWPKEKTYFNIFKKNDKSKSTTAPYDPKSIMHYGFSKAFIWNKIDMPFNFSLTEKDINFISSIYPKK